MGAVWRLIEAHQEAQEYRPSIREIAKRAGLRHTTLANWQTLTRMPDPDHLRLVSLRLGIPYAALLDAALEDAGYRDPVPAGADWADIADLTRRQRAVDTTPDRFKVAQKAARARPKEQHPPEPDSDHQGEGPEFGA